MPITVESPAISDGSTATVVIKRDIDEDIQAAHLVTRSRALDRRGYVSLTKLDSVKNVLSPEQKEAFKAIKEYKISPDVRNLELGEINAFEPPASIKNMKLDPSIAEWKRPSIYRTIAMPKDPRSFQIGTAFADIKTHKIENPYTTSAP